MRLFPEPVGFGRRQILSTGEGDRIVQITPVEPQHTRKFVWSVAAVNDDDTDTGSVVEIRAQALIASAGVVGELWLVVTGVIEAERTAGLAHASLIVGLGIFTTIMLGVLESENPDPNDPARDRAQSRRH